MCSNPFKFARDIKEREGIDSRVGEGAKFGSGEAQTESRKISSRRAREAWEGGGEGDGVGGAEGRDEDTRERSRERGEGEMRKSLKLNIV